MSEPKRKEYKNLTVARDETKTPNKEVFLNIELIDEAISNKKKIEFVYLEYDLNKELKPRRDRTYVVSPYAMVSANEHFYLICKHDKFSNIGQYRIDKIRNVQILREDSQPSPKGFDAHKYAMSATYMFSNDVKKITLKCDHNILDHVIDKFGKNSLISPNEDGTFNATVVASKEGIVFWALQYLEYVELLTPEDVRAEILRVLATNKYDIKR